MAVDLMAQVNRIADCDNLTDLEKKHTPCILASDEAKAGSPGTITVHVGKLMDHPNELDHFIGWVGLYENDVLVARAELAPVASSPVVTFSVALKGSGKVSARAGCNKHGEWESVEGVCCCTCG